MTFSTIFPEPGRNAPLTAQMSAHDLSNFRQMIIVPVILRTILTAMTIIIINIMITIVIIMVIMIIVVIIMTIIRKG